MQPVNILAPNSEYPNAVQCPPGVRDNSSCCSICDGELTAVCSVCSSPSICSEAIGCRYLEELTSSPTVFADNDFTKFKRLPERQSFELCKGPCNLLTKWIPNTSASMEEGTELDALLPASKSMNVDAEISLTEDKCPNSHIIDQPCVQSWEDITCWTTNSDEMQGCLSSEEIVCRICQDGSVYEKLVSPCLCSGTVGFVHVSCLNTWLQITSRTSCELCGFPFPVTKRAARFSEYLRHPRANMDLPNLVCDVACLTVLTPLLFSSVYLTSTGALRYESLGRAGSLCAVVVLLLALLLVYISWASLAVIYHVRVWRAWRDRNCQVSMLCESQIDNTAVPKISPREPDLEAPMERNLKPPSPLKDSDTQTRSTAGDTAILLAPINRLSGWIRINNRITTTTASTT